MKDDFGDRMKLYEGAEAKRKTMPMLPVMVRLDGKGFSKWTKGLERPYDKKLSDIMAKVCLTLVEETGAVVGFTQSDEISLVLYSKSFKSQIYCGGRIQKLVSVLAAMATATFNHLATGVFPYKPPALFDCRVWTVPNQMEASNTILWRERDATKNSISMAAREFYSHKELMNKNGKDMQEMLFAKGCNWNDFPPFFKRGVFIQKQTVLMERVSDVGEPHWEERRKIRTIPDMPSFGQVTNRIGVIFDGEDPVLDVENE